MKPKRTLNLVGLKCPSPIVELNRAMKSMVAGEEVQATADDPAFQLDVQAWCKKTGHTLVQFDQADGTLVALIRKLVA